MNIIAFDTSFHFCSVALKYNGRLYSIHEKIEKKQSALVLLQIEHLIKNANAGSINLILFGKGPGSFTGLRLSVAIAQALSLGWNCPVLGMTSMEIMAFMSYCLHQKIFNYVFQDARKNELYWGGYSFNENSRNMLTNIQVNHLYAVARAIDLKDANQTAFIGDMAPQVFHEKIFSANKPYVNGNMIAPNASYMIKYFEQYQNQLQQNIIQDLELILPLYIRNKVTV